MPIKDNKKSLFDRIRFLRRARVIKTSREAPAWFPRFKRWVYGLAFVALLFLILESGMQYRLPPGLRTATTILDYIVFIAFFVDACLTFYFTVPRLQYFKTNWMDVFVFAPLVLNVVSIQAGAGLIVIRNLLVLAKVFTRSRKFSNILRGVRLNTAQIVAISFFATILVGTLLLTFPTATTDGKGAGFIDALFTSTSATCVTGLIVQDTPTYFSTFGQVVILVLIQLGGLGIMTYSAFVALLFGRFSLGQRKMMQEMFEEEQNVLNMIVYILKMTFIIEAVGAALLFARWAFHFENMGTALYFSVFHSISAFCNAGFSLFSDSLVRFASDPAINLIIILLILVGGIGFIVVYDVTGVFRKRRKSLSPHSKLVLITSTVLVIAGFFIVFFFEFDKSLLGQSLPTKVWASLFQSVTPRTAGFNTLNIAVLSRVTLTILIVLMFIGASPGSTGGGIKTSTFAILLLSLRSTLKAEANVEAFKRTIPTSSVMKALSLLVSVLILVSVIFVLLMIFEEKPYLDLLFETISAFGTVGLSTGVTPELSVGGKLLITVLMYLGRIGPLTMGLALSKSLRRGRISYPDARIMIG
ncbi:MAG: TrkH family potassium uptake protein [bacterium]